MTVVNGIEIDCFNIKPNTINLAIKNNDPIEEKLHVVAVVSNPCLYSRRYILMNEFIKRMEETETNIILYEVCSTFKCGGWFTLTWGKLIFGWGEAELEVPLLHLHMVGHHQRLRRLLEIYYRYKMQKLFSNTLTGEKISLN